MSDNKNQNNWRTTIENIIDSNDRVINIVDSIDRNVNNVLIYFFWPLSPQSNLLSIIITTCSS